MDSLANSIVQILSWAVLLGQIVAVGLFLVFIVSFFNPKGKTILHTVAKFVSDNYVALLFLIALGATVGSLSLSEIASFAPCKLCWWQRIFMYPQTIIAGVALMVNDRQVRKYILPLSITGLVIAFYHYVMQLFPDLLHCSEEVAKCSTKQFASFGYMTIPVMSATAFLLLILVCIIGIKSKK